MVYIFLGTMKDLKGNYLTALKTVLDNIIMLMEIHIKDNGHLNFFFILQN